MAGVMSLSESLSFCLLFGEKKDFKGSTTVQLRKAVFENTNVPERYVLYLNRKPTPDSLFKSMQQRSSSQKVPYSALRAHITPSSYRSPHAPAPNTPPHTSREKKKSHTLTEVLQLRLPMGIDPEVRTKVLKFCSVDTRSSQNFIPDQMFFLIVFCTLKVRQARAVVSAQPRQVGCLQKSLPVNCPSTLQFQSIGSAQAMSENNFSQQFCSN